MAALLSCVEKFGIKSPDCFRKYNHFVGNNEKRNLAKPCVSASVPCCNFLILSKIIYFIRLLPINFGKINSIYVPELSVFYNFVMKMPGMYNLK